MITKISDAIARIIWNPTWSCKRCAEAEKLVHGEYWRLKIIRKGFNKYHRHEIKLNMKQEPCDTCTRYLSEYEYKDLIITNSRGEIHYDPKPDAKSIAQKEKEKQSMPTFSGTPQVGDWVWHVHHQVLAERLTAPFSDRVSAIKDGKNAQETRLHFMRPVKNPPASALGNAEEMARATRVYDAVKKAYNRGQATLEAFTAAQRRRDAAANRADTTTKAEWEALHKKECFNYCPWNLGLGTIIPTTDKNGKSFVGKY